MLLVNKVQISVNEIEKKLGIKIPLEKILKKPLFEINPVLVVKDPANGPAATKVRTGMEFPAAFRVRLKTGEDVEIRYCTNRTPDKDTHGATEKYSPRKLPFDGKSEFVNDAEDKAVYYYLHFFNRQSPFRAEGYPYYEKPFEYEFQDNEAKADAKIAFIQLRAKAVAHANALDGDELIITAKGMTTGNGHRIQGIESMDNKSIKARLMEFADMYPQAYLDSAESQVSHIIGLIFDAIDKGIFVLDTATNSSRWKWAKGPKAGEGIVELSKNSPNSREALVTHIQQTPGVLNDFLPSLLNVRKLEAAKTNINNELAGVDVMSMITGKEKEIEVEEEEHDEEPQTAPWPTEFKMCSPYLKEKTGKGTPAIAGKLWKAIQAKEVDEDNVDDFLAALAETE